MIRAKVIQSGDQQTIVLPSSIHLDGDEVLVEETAPQGSLKISPVQKPTKTDWQAIFRQLDEAGVPDDFLADRDMSRSQERPDW